MAEGKWERFLKWVCRKIGHAKTVRIDEIWMHNGFKHRWCPRCKRIVSSPVDDYEVTGND